MKDTIKHEGIIVEMNASNIKVSMLVLSACASCGSKKMCGVSEQEDKIVEVPFRPEYASFKIGEKVTVQTNRENAALAILWAYLLPAIVLIGVLLVGVLCLKSEVIAILLGLVSVIGYYGILYYFRKTLQRKFTFSIVKEESVNPGN